MSHSQKITFTLQLVLRDGEHARAAAAAAAPPMERKTQKTQISKQPCRLQIPWRGGTASSECCKMAMLKDSTV